MRKVSGFTLVELLVVVAIIALLLAILIPSLNKAKKEAIRIKCLSQFHTLGFAQAQHGLDNKGELVRHARWDPQTIFSRSFGDFWIQNWGTEDKWTGAGLLWYREYIPDPRMIWCPANKSPNLAFDHPEWGWREDPYTQGKKWMASPTHQRLVLSDLDDIPNHSGTAAFADGFITSSFYNPGLEDSVLYHHEIGYSVAYLDGSTNFYFDGDQDILALHIGSGAWDDQETLVWQEYFDR
jgi:prepilin-type N-terminal cleavage/methylation domain-containing protein